MQIVRNAFGHLDIALKDDLTAQNFSCVNKVIAHIWKDVKNAADQTMINNLKMSILPSLKAKKSAEHTFGEIKKKLGQIVLLL